MRENEQVEKKNVCESCGKMFDCGAEVGKCWCFAFDLPVETLTKLRADFDNCLCENCLEKLKSKI